MGTRNGQSTRTEGGGGRIGRRRCQRLLSSGGKTSTWRTGFLVEVGITILSLRKTKLCRAGLESGSCCSPAGKGRELLVRGYHERNDGGTFIGHRSRRYNSLLMANAADASPANDCFPPSFSRSRVCNRHADRQGRCFSSRRTPTNTQTRAQPSTHGNTCTSPHPDPPTFRSSPRG